MILLTGHRGLLGQELKKHLDVTPFEGDISSPTNQKGDLIIHSAAFTDVAKAEINKYLCFHDNVFGTFNLTQIYKDIPFVFISSEYAKNPISHYARTKAWGEEIVKAHKAHLIIRTLFKPTPWEFDVAYTDQYTQGDYVDVIAKLIAEEVEKWDKETCKTVYVGTGRKTMYELAFRTKKDVRPNVVTNPIIPRDYL